MSKKWTHDELQHDLAAHLGRASDRMVWEDMQMGPSGSMRPDVFTMRKSYTKPAPIAYEIKVSVADFRSDVTSGKWQKYLDIAGGVIFAVPKGLVSKADLPKGCGLMVRGEDSWRTIKAPTLHPVTLPQKALLKLLIDGVRRERQVQVATHKELHFPSQRARKQLGNDVVRAVQDLAGFKAHIKYIKESELAAVKREVEREKQELLRQEPVAREALDGLAEVVGLPAGSSPYKICLAASRLKEQLSRDEKIKALSVCLRGVKRNVEAMENELSEAMD